jgi:hypothetical protein
MQIIPNWIGLSRETFVTHTFPPSQKNRVAFDFYLCAFSLTIYIKIFYNDNLFQSRLARILWDLTSSEQWDPCEAGELELTQPDPKDFTALLPSPLWVVGA